MWPPPPAVSAEGAMPALPSRISGRKKVALKVQYPDLPRSGIRPAKTSLANRTYLGERDAGGLRPTRRALALAGDRNN